MIQMSLKKIGQAFVIAVIITLITLSCFAQPAQNFRRAKKLLIQLYQQHPDIPTFYCHAPIRWQGKKGVPQLAAAGYQIRKQPKRAHRIEWEHVMPAYWFGHQLRCWQQGGRKNCARTSARFRRMEGDLHNLVPAIGEVNGDRSNYRYSDWQGPGLYGHCQMAIDFANKKARPPQATHGFIGRDYLYMASHYDLKLSQSQRRLMTAWAKQPATPWECERNRWILKRQGNDNPFVTQACRQV